MGWRDHRQVFPAHCFFCARATCPGRAQSIIEVLSAVSEERSAAVGGRRALLGDDEDLDEDVAWDVGRSRYVVGTCHVDRTGLLQRRNVNAHLAQLLQRDAVVSFSRG